MVKPSLKLKKDSLARIKDAALYNFKNSAVPKDLADEFLAGCWTDAVLSELNRLNLTDLSFTLTVKNIKVD